MNWPLSMEAWPEVHVARIMYWPLSMEACQNHGYIYIYWPLSMHGGMARRQILILKYKYCEANE
jgi:hypothetical protein